MSAEGGPRLPFPLPGPPGSPRAWRLFELGFRPWLKRRLAGIHLGGIEAAGAALPPNEPLLLVANHTSWYDGFLLREVHRRIRPASPLRTVMLDAELRKAPILGWIGGSGFDPERPVTLRRTLREIELLRDQGVTLSFFPQGRIFPATRRPLGFRPGVSLLARGLAPLHLLPVALHLEMGNHTRPAAWILAGEPVRVAARSGSRRAAAATPDPAPAAASDPATPEALEASVTTLLDRIQRHLHTHGEGAAEHWPP